jgi:hypothetical protein
MPIPHDRDSTQSPLEEARRDTHHQLKPPKEYDEIETSLNDGFLPPDAPWGFVVYRTVYGADSDGPWVRMLSRLRSAVPEALSSADQTNLLPRHQMTVIEDKQRLAGADPHTVRHLFRAWVADDLTPQLYDIDAAAYEGRAAVHAKLLSNDIYDETHPLLSIPPRWNFCLFVDQTCLRDLDAGNAAWNLCIMLLTTNWQEDRFAKVAKGWADGETDELMEEVGWMHINVIEYVRWYSLLVAGSGWMTFYQRPSTIRYVW